MPTISGRNCKIEIALTIADAISPTEVTKAYPGVVTMAAHGLSNGQVGYWLAGGSMLQLDQQAIVVGAVASGTFSMPGLDTSDYDEFDPGPTLHMGATWGTLAESSGYTVGGGAAAQLEDTRMHEAKTRNVAGNLANQDVTLDLRIQEVSTVPMQFLERNAQRGLPALFKITKNGRILRAFYGVPSLPGEQVSTGQLASGQINVIVPAWCLKPNV